MDDREAMQQGIPVGVLRIAMPNAAPDVLRGCDRRWDEIIAECPPISDSPTRSGDELATIIYTSGTTGEPKGVMHSANSLMANIVPYAERLALGSQDVVLMASPMAHQTGFMYGLMMPFVLRASAVLLDIELCIAHFDAHLVLKLLQPYLGLAIFQF